MCVGDRPIVCPRARPCVRLCERLCTLAYCVCMCVAQTMDDNIFRDSQDTSKSYRHLTIFLDKCEVHQRSS